MPIDEKQTNNDTTSVDIEPLYETEQIWCHPGFGSSPSHHRIITITFRSLVSPFNYTNKIIISFTKTKAEMYDLNYIVNSCREDDSTQRPLKIKQMKKIIID